MIWALRRTRFILNLRMRPGRARLNSGPAATVSGAWLALASVAVAAIATWEAQAHNAGVSTSRIVVHGRTVEVEINALGRDYEKSAGVRITEAGSGEVNRVALAVMAPSVLTYIGDHVAVFAGSNARLGVGFQEVVHLVRTEEAEVAKLQCSTERPDEHPQECSPDAQRSRGDGAVCGSRPQQGRSRAPVQHYCEDCRQMGRTVRRKRRRWFARSLLQACFIAKPNSACHVLRRRGFAPAALHRQADCRRGRRVSGDRQPHSSAAGS